MCPMNTITKHMSITPEVVHFLPSRRADQSALKEWRRWNEVQGYVGQLPVVPIVSLTGAVALLLLATHPALSPGAQPTSEAGRCEPLCRVQEDRLIRSNELGLQAGGGVIGTWRGTSQAALGNIQCRHDSGSCDPEEAEGSSISHTEQGPPLQGQRNRGVILTMQWTHAEVLTPSTSTVGVSAA